MFPEVWPSIRHMGTIAVRAIESKEQHRGVRLIVSYHQAYPLETHHLGSFKDDRSLFILIIECCQIQLSR